ncbi:MAG TPA: TadE/TadG family type IV pilus assembly protein [Sphingomonas sp.]|nr:TadE/TadG family type IV pilus assembly protein [Sphingomonas sp.]
MNARLLRLRRDGVTSVEFAVLLPGLLTLICGSIELGHMIFARMVLEGAVIEAARAATASLETGTAQREETMRTSILRAMRPFPTADGRAITIRSTVYRDFTTAYPEAYTDYDRNGHYGLGEPYVDRNANGRWDGATPIAGTMGGPGDVVGLTAIFPKKVLFGFLGAEWAVGSAIELRATTVVRNEAVVRTGA